MNDKQVAFLVGYIFGLLCSLYAIHREDLTNYINKKLGNGGKK